MDEKQLERLEAQEEQSQIEHEQKYGKDEQYITRSTVTKPKGKVRYTRIHTEKIPVFGSPQYEKQVLELEDAEMKKKGFLSSTIHWCNIKHYSKKEKLEGFDYDRIDEECLCNENKRKDYGFRGLKLHVCPNGHGQLVSYTLKIMKSCKSCEAILNKYASSTDPIGKEQREKLAAEAKLRSDGEKLQKEAKLNAEIELQAKVLARARIIEEEMRKEKKK